MLEQICPRQKIYYFSLQEMAGGWIPNQRDESRVEGIRTLPMSVNNSSEMDFSIQEMCSLSLDRPTGLCDVDKAHSSADFKIKTSSVHPIQTPPIRRSTQTRAGKNSQKPFDKHLLPSYQVGFCSY